MKLSELTPCHNCQGPLLKPNSPGYLVTVSVLLLDQDISQRVLATATNFQHGGNSGLYAAELIQENADKAVMPMTTKTYMYCQQCAATVTVP